MMHKRERIFRGIPVSGGFARGRAFRYQQYLPRLEERILKPEQVSMEVARFKSAVATAEKDLRRLHSQVKQEMGRDFADFIDVQLSLLTDEEVLKETERLIRENLRNAEFAYAQTLKNLAGPVRGAKLQVFRERFVDIADVSGRVLSVLMGDDLPSIHTLEPGSVIVARELPPSEAALLDPAKVAGLVLEGGGKTSHTAIMAKAKEIPAVFGVDAISKQVNDGEEVLVDGYRGLAILNPSQNRLKTYETEIKRYHQHRASLKALREEEPVTPDGRMIDLSANVEFLIEAKLAKENGARGIGLFRTEYMYLAKRRPPTEAEQLEIFLEVAQLFQPFPVIIRTFDLGGDKVIPGYTEANPFLGWRAIRFCLDDLSLFKTQLRAILRASVLHNIKIMFPMIATIEELRRAKLLVQDVKKELRREGFDFDENLEIGVMVETPAAALLAEQLARECRFLSIGSNDLTQYTLAVDRGNERVAKLFDHFHPAVLQLIKKTIDAAHQQGIWVGMCGEFAADPLGIVLLLGMGVDEISVVPGMIPEAKQVIRTIDTGVALEVAQEALKLSTALEVERLLQRELHRRFPKLVRSLFAVKGVGGE
ncbi:MAG: phosphoenolpyruvate--protein phosphotransferase [candidate division WOR-3 bacterium]